MPRALKVCPTPGCPELVTSGRCAAHRREAEQARGNATQRGYTGRGHRAFRAAVLDRDPLCVLCLTRGVTRLATVADHYPTSRRDLVAAGLDPNDPSRGRGLCHVCHSKATAEHQPGGFAAR